MFPRKGRGEGESDPRKVDWQLKIAKLSRKEAIEKRENGSILVGGEEPIAKNYATN